MSSIIVNYQINGRDREVQIISLEQVIGTHVPLPSNLDIASKFSALADHNDNIEFFHQMDSFTVFDSNRTDITRGHDGVSRWILLTAVKTAPKVFYLLLIGNKIWGIQTDLGHKLKQSIKKYGTERIEKYLLSQIDSIVNDPTSWEEIFVFN